jgi:hypothetical protein
VRKTLILIVIILLSSAAIAFGSWQVATWVKGGGDSKTTGVKKASTNVTEGSSASESAAADEAAGQSGGAAAASGQVSAQADEPGQYTTPDMRYVSETQRHQNFFRAVGEGRVRRLDVTATDFQPAGDPHTSYVYFVLSTTDGGRSDGTFVMQYSSGMWRIGAVNQLTGSLQGGTNVQVPSTFEDTIAREIKDLQWFLTKVAEGRLDYLMVDAVSNPSANVTVLTGKTASVGGKVANTEMTLRQDYGLWHLTNIRRL